MTITFSTIPSLLAERIQTLQQSGEVQPQPTTAEWGGPQGQIRRVTAIIKNNIPKDTALICIGGRVFAHLALYFEGCTLSEYKSIREAIRPLTGRSYFEDQGDLIAWVPEK